MPKTSKPLIQLSASNTTTPPQVRLARPHPGQQTILNSPGRYKVVACGRRFGKTALALMLITESAWHGMTTWWLAPTYAMANQVWGDLKATMTNAHGITISESQRTITLPTGGSIAIRSAHYPDLLRGAGLDFVVLDEAAYMSPDVWPQVIRPMLLERRGGAVFLSTPNGKNWFYDLYALGCDPSQVDWRSFHFPSWVNPLVAYDEILDIRATTSERVFREEYLAEFLDDAGQVFRGVRDAATAPTDVQPQSRQRTVMGVDWGREGDYTCLAVIDADSRQMVALERFNKIGWALQRGRLQALAQRWQPAVIWAEANSIGSPNIEALQQAGLPVRSFTTTSRSKPPLIEGLALAIERGQLALLPDETLLHELASYTMTRLAGGGYRYSAPPGQHDDCVIATALAWHGVRHGGMRVDFA